MIRWRAVTRRAEAALARVDLKLDVSQPLSVCSIAIQQLIAIARALDVSAKLLVLDEPTSSLDEQEVKELFNVMRKLRAEGMGIVFVTHFLDQVYAISDRITVLRDGRLVGEYETAKLPKVELVSRMIGKEITQLESARSAVETDHKPETLVELRKFGRAGSIAPMDMTIGKGEIVGLAGLLGSGRTETARLLFGIDKPQTGEMLVEGRKVAFHSPRQAIREGFAFTPENRRSKVLSRTCRCAKTSSSLSKRARAPRIRFRGNGKRRLPRNSSSCSASVPRTRADGDEPQRRQPTEGAARPLAGHAPRLLILDEPTRGIDVGAKAEIEKLMHSLRDEGMAIYLSALNWRKSCAIRSG
jgi:simple sugar transport system ATP-binding protein